MGFGTSTTSDHSRERALARAVLAILVGLLAALIAFTGGSFNPLTAIAQESPTPSPFTIQFINPGTGEEGPSNEISAKADGTDSAYHIVAWVNQVPSDALVEFKYRADGEDVDRNIGQAQRVGTTDTFELDWTLSNISDGAGTLKAILFSGGTEVARDEEPVQINNASEAGPIVATENRAETVELTYPTNGGQLGLFTPPGGGPANAVFDASSSDGTTRINVFYTVSSPGTQPSWVGCGSETKANSQDGIRCTLAEGDSPNNVTAVAARAEDDEADPRFTPEDSGDGHRVFAYSQVASSITLSPVTQRKDLDGEGNYPCSDPITGTVVDQNGRRIAGANVDVHAAGPTDNLFFDDSGNNSSAHQPPDQGNHTTESGVDCESDSSPKPFSGTQGEHEVAGEGDIKHIESTTGTNDSGQFTFQLNIQPQTTQNQTGTTQITMWADRDDDDLQCGEETQGDASIGWGVDPATPTGTPNDVSSCPQASPTPTATPTESPSPTPTESPSPTPTESPTPSPSPTDGEEECPEGAICGDDGDNRIEGTEGDDVIFGRGGDDVIFGKGGNDTIFGEEGDDVIWGGPGADDLRGGFGDDTIRGRQGKDSARGGPGRDTLVGQQGNDILRGGGGHDTLRGNRGRDTLRGGRGNDTLQGGKRNDLVIGGRGRDVLKGGRGKDDLRGNIGHDTLGGGRWDDVLHGGRGNDTLNGGPGTDVCRPGRGNDRLRNCER